MRLRTKASLTLRGYRTIHTLAPGLLLVTCLEGLFSSALPFLQIFMSALVIDAFSRGGTLRELLSLALLTAALSGVLSLLSSGLKKLKNYFGHRFFRLIEQPLKDKILQMDYSAVEQLDTHLKIEQLRVLRDTMGYGLPRLFFCTEAAVLALSQILYSISLLSGAFTPVSYTHLDVYKRQTRRRSPVLWRRREGMERKDCARRNTCRFLFGQGFNSPRLHQMARIRTQRWVRILCF